MGDDMVYYSVASYRSRVNSSADSDCKILRKINTVSCPRRQYFCKLWPILFAINPQIQGIENFCFQSVWGVDFNKYFACI